MRENHYLRFMQDLCLKAGDICREAFQHTHIDMHYKNKKLKDVVTDYDLRIEKFYRAQIQANFPDHGILGEEIGAWHEDHEYLWVFDPIDGTSNFSQKLPLFGTMIALIHRMEITCSVIYLPLLDEMYTAEKNEGAFLNQHPIKIQKTANLKESFVFLDGGSINNRWFARFYQMNIDELSRIRTLGSAAVQLGYTASGRFDLYISRGGYVYDYAPGVLLVQEAGGVCKNFTGDLWQINDRQLIAGFSPLIDKALIQINFHDE